MMGSAVVRRAKGLARARVCTDNSAEEPKPHASSGHFDLGPGVPMPRVSCLDLLSLALNAREVQRCCDTSTLRWLSSRPR